ncbi:uncharacterized protein BKA55DRAFT_491325, partial [Fusarium redolens]
PNLVQDIISDTTLEASLHMGEGKSGPIQHFAQELAERLIKFQGCYTECHQAAKHNHIEDTNEHISLTIYL